MALAVAVLCLLALTSTVGFDPATVSQSAWTDTDQSSPTALREPIYDVAVASEAGTVLLRRRTHLERRRLESGEALELGRLNAAGATAIAQSTDGRALVIGYADGTILFQQSHESRTDVQAVTHSSGINSVALSRDARLAAIGCTDGAVLVLDTGSHRVRHCLQYANHDDRRTTFTFSRDGELLAAGASNGSIRCWRVASGRQIAGFELPSLSALEFTPDGEGLIAASLHERSIHCLDVVSQEKRWSHRRPVGWPGYTCLAVSPAGTLAVAGDYAGRLLVFDLALGEFVGCVQAHGGAVSAVQFSPEGHLLFAGSHDGNLTVWEHPMRQAGHHVQGPLKPLAVLSL